MDKINFVYINQNICEIAEVNKKINEGVLEKVDYVNASAIFHEVYSYGG